MQIVPMETPPQQTARMRSGDIAATPGNTCSPDRRLDPRRSSILMSFPSNPVISLQFLIAFAYFFEPLVAEDPLGATDCTSQ